MNELIQSVKMQPCVACKPGEQKWPTEAHHVITRGAGGKNEPDNLMPLCKFHHTGVGGWHQLGRFTFISNHPNVEKWLVDHNVQWLLDQYHQWIEDTDNVEL